MERRQQSVFISLLNGPRKWREKAGFVREGPKIEYRRNSVIHTYKEINNGTITSFKWNQINCGLERRTGNEKNELIYFTLLLGKYKTQQGRIMCDYANAISII